ncbi:alpha/beta hydrolase family protein [Pontibacter akesuensis]|uniref:Predicted alpha/beta hydrolase n=1 Tax=Pontibacter akesuensis TaxID=388950 RepID=A0A1I7KH93_9BACT|nr:alpha/beta fold hydrolase [Pontibacter akesuensis]GHA79071.1 alpha/beta hydrolase [Pontibacter akesuensis]SFU96772.1 Predicted alpha/beta hydrolase [Pontibacter akesuensis]
MALQPDITAESIFIPVTEKDTLHLRRFSQQQQGAPVFLVHGSIENGRIFYSNSGKGFAPYLAQQGYDVFVADLRGRGQSTPAISGKSKFGLTETLQEDFPAFINKIKELKGDVPQLWGAHSWGGVLMLAYLARPVVPVEVQSMAFFATKRRISVQSLQRFFMIDVMWNLVANIAVATTGALYAKKLKMGSDSETRLTHSQTNEWVEQRRWLDWNDNFDYAAALRNMQLPPILYLAGANDKVLGHPEDVQRLRQEAGASGSEFRLLGKEAGYKHDYGHIDILTHPDAPEDHFPEVVAWFKMRETMQLFRPQMGQVKRRTNLT